MGGIMPMTVRELVERDYQEWKRHVEKHTMLPEYKMRRLWKMNFSSTDIKADKHHAVFPVGPPRPIKPDSGRKRGRSVSERGLLLFYARAMRNAAAVLLAHYNMTPEMRERVAAEHKRFQGLVNDLARKQG